MQKEEFLRNLNEELNVDKKGTMNVAKTIATTIGNIMRMQTITVYNESRINILKRGMKRSVVLERDLNINRIITGLMEKPFCDKDEIFKFQHQMYYRLMETEIKSLEKENTHMGLLLAKQRRIMKSITSDVVFKLCNEYLKNRKAEETIDYGRENEIAWKTALEEKERQSKSMEQWLKTNTSIKKTMEDEKGIMVSHLQVFNGLTSSKVVHVNIEPIHKTNGKKQIEHLTVAIEEPNDEDFMNLDIDKECQNTQQQPGYNKNENQGKGNGEDSGNNGNARNGTETENIENGGNESENNTKTTENRTIGKTTEEGRTKENQTDLKQNIKDNKQVKNNKERNDGTIDENKKMEGDKKTNKRKYPSDGRGNQLGDPEARGIKQVRKTDYKGKENAVKTQDVLRRNGDDKSFGQCDQRKIERHHNRSTIDNRFNENTKGRSFGTDLNRNFHNDYNRRNLSFDDRRKSDLTNRGNFYRNENRWNQNCFDQNYSNHGNGGQYNYNG